jgi:aryl-alcohol dehydrogenase-like predicted oxidoreductase
MEYSDHGSSSLKVSKIGFGCMSLPPEEQTAVNLLHKAFDEGINFFDTADIYQHGLNEINVGKAVHGKRDKIFVSSKVGNINRPDGSGLDWNPSKEHILASIDQSLHRLNTDYVDLYLLHGGTIQDNIDETIETFEKLKKEGKIRNYGISSIRPNVIREYVKRSSMIAEMIQYSLLDRRPEEECLDLLNKNNIGVLVRGGVAQGLLIDKSERPYLELTAKEVKNAAQAIKSISNENRSATQTAIRYVLKHPAVTSAVVGMRNEKQLMDVISTFYSPDLNNDEMEKLKGSVRPLLYSQHRN